MHVAINWGTTDTVDARPWNLRPMSNTLRALGYNNQNPLTLCIHEVRGVVDTLRASDYNNQFPIAPCAPSESRETVGDAMHV